MGCICGKRKSKDVRVYPTKLPSEHGINELVVEDEEENNELLHSTIGPTAQELKSRQKRSKYVEERNIRKSKCASKIPLEATKSNQKNNGPEGKESTSMLDYNEGNAEPIIEGPKVVKNKVNHKKGKKKRAVVGDETTHQVELRDGRNAPDYDSD